MSRLANATALEGTLATKSLVTLVVNALNRRLSGSLELAHGSEVVATMVFVRGFPVKARTAYSFHLVPLLAEVGILHETELPRLMPTLLGGPELHGRVLVRKGFLTVEEVEVGLREQIARQLGWMGQLGPETEYRFLAGVDQLPGYGGELVAPFDPLPFIWASVRAQTPPAYARARISRFGASTFHLKEDAEPARFYFDEAALSVVSVLRQWTCRSDEIAAYAAVTEDFAFLVLHALLLVRQVVVVTPVHVPAAASEAPVSVSSPVSSKRGMPPDAPTIRDLDEVDSEPDVISVRPVPLPPPALSPRPVPRPAKPADAPPLPPNGPRKRTSVRMARVRTEPPPAIPRHEPDEAPPTDEVVHVKPSRPSAPRRRSATMAAVTDADEKKG